MNIYILACSFASQLTTSYAAFLLVSLLIEGLSPWLTDRIEHNWLTAGLTDWLTNCLTDYLTVWLTDWFTCSQFTFLPTSLLDYLDESRGNRSVTIERFESWARNDDNEDGVKRVHWKSFKSRCSPQQKRREGRGATPVNPWILSSTGILNSLRYRKVKNYSVLQSECDII